MLASYREATPAMAGAYVGEKETIFDASAGSTRSTVYPPARDSTYAPVPTHGLTGSIPSSTAFASAGSTGF